jgi:hypothetical protein
MDAWIMIFAIAVFGVVIGKLLYELNPVAWKSAAARVEDDTPSDGAIDDYLEWVEDRHQDAQLSSARMAPIWSKSLGT